MSVTLYENDFFNYYDDGYVGYFPDPAYTADLSNYALGYNGDTWDNDISSLYTSTYLSVFEEQNYGGDYAILRPATTTSPA